MIRRVAKRKLGSNEIIGKKLIQDKKMMTSWDKGSISYANIVKEGNKDNNIRKQEDRYKSFFENYSVKGEYIYRKELRENYGVERYTMSVCMNSLIGFDSALGMEFLNSPDIQHELMENAVSRLAEEITNTDEESKVDIKRRIQIQIIMDNNPLELRSIDSEYIGRLVKVYGIVTSATVPSAKPMKICIMCRQCETIRYIDHKSGFGSANLPRMCSGPEIEGSVKSKCPSDPFVVIPDKSICIDQQILKLQEPPNSLPVGELPRHMLLTMDRYLVNKVTPGSRVYVTGIYSIYQSRNSSSKTGVAIRCPYLKVLGIEMESGMIKGQLSMSMISEEEQRMREMARDPGIYERIVRSIAPSIYGNDSIKRAIVCLLFGGTRKRLPDGTRIRGDINVLLLGDPGTAKSQLLKFVEKVAPICVYTSGKGSSAAGLTASVIKDNNSGEFYLEGGAMVLGDGGVVCIDEFDKMRDDDRVAIHEAMEQQTISIAKAGITTVLNSRTSVLAASNPIFGRYDDLKSPGENIDFSTTIMSRFDMIFIVRDVQDQETDISLAKHILNIHARGGNVKEVDEGEISVEDLKMYIGYCKSSCSPRLSKGAAEQLSNKYVEIRRQVSTMERDTGEKSTIPITVRQLEAIIRTAESLAKMRLSSEVLPVDVDEAIRLFTASTMMAVKTGQLMENGMLRPELMKEVERAEKWIRTQYPIGVTIGYNQLLREAIKGNDLTEYAVTRAIAVMERQEKIVFKNNRKQIFRQQ